MSSHETTAPRQHAFTSPALPQLPEPTHAERVRTLMSLTSVATLSTISRKHPESEGRLPMQPLRWATRCRW